MAEESRRVKRRRYRAVKGFDYPDEHWLAVLKKAGGRRNLTPEQAVKFRSSLIHVAAGDSCDGVPKFALDGLLGDGTIEELES